MRRGGIVDPRLAAGERDQPSVRLQRARSRVQRTAADGLAQIHGEHVAAVGLEGIVPGGGGAQHGPELDVLRRRAGVHSDEGPDVLRLVDGEGLARAVVVHGGRAVRKYDAHAVGTLAAALRRARQAVGSGGQQHLILGVVGEGRHGRGRAAGRDHAVAPRKRDSVFRQGRSGVVAPEQIPALPVQPDLRAPGDGAGIVRRGTAALRAAHGNHRAQRTAGVGPEDLRVARPGDRQGRRGLRRGFIRPRGGLVRALHGGVHGRVRSVQNVGNVQNLAPVRALSQRSSRRDVLERDVRRAAVRALYHFKGGVIRRGAPHAPVYRADSAQLCVCHTD